MGYNQICIILQVIYECTGCITLWYASLALWVLCVARFTVAGSEVIDNNTVTVRPAVHGMAWIDTNTIDTCFSRSTITIGSTSVHWT
jgi:hypothetical protein